jgi:hypothetical protein
MTLIGDALRVACLPLQSNPRCILRTCIADLITGWGHCVTNRRHTLFHAHLLFEAPYEHCGCQLHHRASQDLVGTLFLRKQHIETQNIPKRISKLSISIKPINYLHKAYQLYFPIKYYTNCVISTTKPIN